MTRRLRTVCAATGLLIALGAGAVALPPNALAEPSPGVHAEPSRAGSTAGEGRERPGRREAARPPEDVAPETEAAATTVVPESPRKPPSVPQQPSPPVQQAARPAEPVLRILPLGSGLILIGLGLGLALLGWRLRRMT